MAKTIVKEHKPVKTVKPQKEKAPVMTTAGNVKTENAPTIDAEPEKLSPAQMAKKIEAAAPRQSDQFEFDDAEEGKAVFDKLPPGEFVIQEGNKTVIQKL